MNSIITQISFYLTAIYATRIFLGIKIKTLIDDDLKTSIFPKGNLTVYFLGFLKNKKSIKNITPRLLVKGFNILTLICYSLILLFFITLFFGKHIIIT